MLGVLKNKKKVETCKQKIKKAFKEKGMPIFEIGAGGHGISTLYLVTKISYSVQFLILNETWTCFEVKT